MRLIDADALKFTMLYKENWLMGTGVEAPAVWKSDVDDMPTIDAVPVVRCRECQKWKKKFELDNGQVFGACDRFYGAETEDSFFCRDGQRGEDGDGDGDA